MDETRLPPFQVTPAAVEALETLLRDSDSIPAEQDPSARPDYYFAVLQDPEGNEFCIT